MARSSIAIVVLAAMVWSLSAMAQTPIPGDSDSPGDGRATRSPLKLTVKTDKGSYHVGDTIHVTLLLKNPTKKAVPATFATGQKYDVFLLRPPVEKKPAEMVWQWSLGMMFTQMVTTTTLAPGQTVQFEVKYPPDDGTHPAPLAKGAYIAKATIITIGRGPKPEATVKFRVK